MSDYIYIPAKVVKTSVSLKRDNIYQMTVEVMCPICRDISRHGGGEHTIAAIKTAHIPAQPGHTRVCHGKYARIVPHNELTFDIPEFGTQKPRKARSHPTWSETY